MLGWGNGCLTQGGGGGGGGGGGVGGGKLLPAFLLAAASGAHALKDASPFLLLASDPIPGSAVQNQEIATAHDVQTDLSHILNACEDRLYILLAQPGLRAEDVRNAKQMPGLSGRVEKMASGSGGGKVWEIPNVIGSVDLEAVALEGASGCANAGMRMYEKEEDGGAWRGEHEAKGMMVTVPKMQFDLTQTRTEEERTRMLSETDTYISTHLSALDHANISYTLVYTSETLTSDGGALEHAAPPYEMDDDYPSTLHTDLKRDGSDVHALRAAPKKHENNNSTGEDNGKDNGKGKGNGNGNGKGKGKGNGNGNGNGNGKGNGNIDSDLPLFEKYQFFTPALFMGLSVAILLLSILYVGLTAIAGLEVSYAAFSKEMGPNAQGRGKQQ
ncbi:hypothetical protein B0A50_04825 [Salinomyces thailandicus]|uniref:Protein BIG1 n=1 Tax=Salinomyces thailandicus TaxID=706561 RepID=A0A4U0TZ93_9PEZI|nr:hypothetical protein B0A50_04825 [Salinomyces thailandica]